MTRGEPRDWQFESRAANAVAYILSQEDKMLARFEQDHDIDTFGLLADTISLAEKYDSLERIDEQILQTGGEPSPSNASKEDA